MDEARWFHFSGGPVQSWVVQARRTDDLWSGSFLLSYLTALAAQEVRRQGGRILIPSVTDAVGNLRDPLLRFLETGTMAPRFGTMPNRLVAEVGDGFDAPAVVAAFHQGWQEIAAAVATRLERAFTPSAHEIWERQVSGFWEVMWALGDAGDLEVLDRRKLWRTHVPSPEPGDKCMLMPTLQELSGRIRSRSRDDAETQDAFWADMQKVVRHRLEDRERLSAVALIKRMFPAVAQEVWDVNPPDAFPSTLLLAAVPWLKTRVSSEHEWLVAYGQAVRGCVEASGHAYRSFGSLAHVPEDIQDVLALDAAIFHPSTFEGDREHPRLQAQARRWWNDRRKAPSTYYAVVVMDGDHMGQWLDCRQEEISERLLRFGGAVEEVARQHDGVLVYAGGDDVMALAPLDHVIDFCLAVEQLYRRVFADVREAELGSPTVSAAVVFAHMKAPLGAVLAEAHRVLDAVAKESCGRNAVAMEVFRNGGPDARTSWSGHWESLTAPNGWRAVADSVGSPAIGSTYLHRVARLVERWGPVMDTLDAEAVLRAEMDPAPRDDRPEDVPRVAAVKRLAAFIMEGVDQAAPGLRLAEFLTREKAR